MRIQKTSLKTPTGAHIVDGYSTSTTDGYSCNIANTLFQEKVEKGRVYANTMIGGTAGGTDIMTKDITFTKQYTNVPIVLVNIGTNRASSYYGYIASYTRNNTNTGCTLCANINITTDQETWIDYVVISMD